ncbi:MAG: hypothetical protein AAB514_01110 [Patescibacteria group bacterium]
MVCQETKAELAETEEVAIEEMVGGIISTEGETVMIIRLSA